MLETPPDVSRREEPVARAPHPDAKTEPLREPLSNLAVELTRVSAELQSINAGFQAQLQQAVEEMRHAMELDSHARLESMKAGFEAQLKQQAVDLQRAAELELQAQLDSMNAGLLAQLQQAEAEIQQTMERDFKARLEKEVQAAREQLTSRGGDVKTEIHRVTNLLESVGAEITAMIDDPNAELSKVMRKKGEESVLRSYLEGLKFAAGEQATKT